jgi:hypothetical protein
MFSLCYSIFFNSFFLEIYLEAPNEKTTFKTQKNPELAHFGPFGRNREFNGPILGLNCRYREREKLRRNQISKLLKTRSCKDIWSLQSDDGKIKRRWGSVP